jgi:hypothetical protein
MNHNQLNNLFLEYTPLTISTWVLEIRVDLSWSEIVFIVKSLEMKKQTFQCFNHGEAQMQQSINKKLNNCTHNTYYIHDEMRN